MRTQLHDRTTYEDRYDHTTVFITRLDMKAFLGFRDKWHEQSPDNEENKF